MNSMAQNHITPPSGVTKFIAKNPFEADLTSRLHLSMISPTVFSTKMVNSKENSPGFRWTVDELAHCQPAKIDELTVQPNHFMSPDTENKAQEAIRRFFSENKIAPSPLDTKPKEVSQKLGMNTPVRSFNATFEEIPRPTRDCWSQTVLTLPPKLPEQIEEVLKPFCTFTQEQNIEAEDNNNSTNSSLRRKLFEFHQSEDSDIENSLSPIKNDELLFSNSPPQSGILADCTPLRRVSAVQRSYGTPEQNLRSPVGSVGNISPINYCDEDISPIARSESEPMSCQSIKMRERAKSRLDFTFDMSVEEDKEHNSSGFTSPEQNKKSVNKNLFSEMIIKSGHTCASPETKIARMSDYYSEQSAQIYSSTLQQNNTLLNQQCTMFSSQASNSQDTGYQTTSMNTMETIDEADAWSDNAMNFYSSTPSKNH